MRINRRAVALLALAGAIGAVSSVAYARPGNVVGKVSKVEKNPDKDKDGKPKPHSVKIEVKRKDKDGDVTATVTVPLPGKGIDATGKAKAIAAALNADEDFKWERGSGASASYGNLTINSDGNHTVQSVKKLEDSTGEKDLFATAGTGARFDIGVRDGYAAITSTSTNFWETGEVEEGSSFTCGVEGLNTVRLDLMPGMRMTDVLASAYSALTLDPNSPQMLLDSMSFQNDVLSFNFPDGSWNADWGFAIQNTDMGLSGIDWARIETVPAPGSFVLLTGALMIAGRRRR